MFLDVSEYFMTSRLNIIFFQIQYLDIPNKHSNLAYVNSRTDTITSLQFPWSSTFHVYTLWITKIHLKRMICWHKINHSTPQICWFRKNCSIACLLKNSLTYSRNIFEIESILLKITCYKKKSNIGICGYRYRFQSNKLL